MEYIRHTFSRPIRTSPPKIAAPVPVKHWSNFEAILDWQERTSDALDDGFYSDEPAILAPLPILNAAVRENDRRRSWAAYRKVVEADPNTTIAPPWPPFVAPPSPLPSPDLSVSPVWAEPLSPPGLGRGVSCNRKDSPLLLPLELAHDGYAWWKYVLAASPPCVDEAPASRSGSECGGFRPFSDSDTAGTSPSSFSSASGGRSLALRTPAEAQIEVGDAGAGLLEPAAAAAGADEDLAACIAQMLLECREDVDSHLALGSIQGQLDDDEDEGEEDSLQDAHVYDCRLEKEIRERAAIAQHLNWMLRGVLPMG